MKDLQETLELLVDSSPRITQFRMTLRWIWRERLYLGICFSEKTRPMPYDKLLQNIVDIAWE